MQKGFFKTQLQSTPVDQRKPTLQVNKFLIVNTGFRLEVVFGVPRVQISEFCKAKSIFPDLLAKSYYFPMRQEHEKIYRLSYKVEKYAQARSKRPGLKTFKPPALSPGIRIGVSTLPTPGIFPLCSRHGLEKAFSTRLSCD